MRFDSESSASGIGKNGFFTERLNECAKSRVSSKHMGGMIHENVGGLKDRVSKEAQLKLRLVDVVFRCAVLDRSNFGFPRRHSLETAKW